MTQKTAIGELTAVELLELYQRRQLSPVEVVDDVLARIDLHNPAVNAYCHVDGEGARAAARASEQRWQRGEPLRVGMPRVRVRSLIEAGTPSSRPQGSPRCQRCSLARAVARAPSPSTWQ